MSPAHRLETILNQLIQQVQLAKQAFAQGDYARAINICDHLLARSRGRDDLLNIKALSLFALEQYEAAEVVMRQALALNPRIAGMHLNAADIYRALSRDTLAKQHAIEAARLGPRDKKVLLKAADMCRQCGDYSRTLRIIDQCLQVHPDFFEGWCMKGRTLVDLGKSESGQLALEKAIELNPEDSSSLNLLVKLRGDRLSDTDIVAQLEHNMTHAKEVEDRAGAAFVLGNLHHRDGQYDAAFDYYREANNIMALANPCDIDDWEQKVDQHLDVTTNMLSHSDAADEVSAKLVFIFGMPRSGTSLCEQVLSAHSSVIGCGELSTMHNIEGAFLRSGMNPYKLEPGSKDLAQAAELYLSALPAAWQKYQRVTDKALMNFERIGLIHRMFPQARFLFCKRHPLDTILSCFMQQFQSGLRFAFDLGHITRTYIAHVKLMRHWLELLPEYIHTVCYEDYVGNQEEETRQIASFLQIGLEPAMLNPHQQKRTVATASNLQVRKAVYTSSIGRWKHYRSHLEDVIEHLQNENLLDKDLNSLV